MLEDVERVVQGKTPVRFHGRMGGIMPMVDEILADVQKLAEEVRSKE
jgi:2-oxoglutarate ferredoxin oxidoreductase subunit alpha